MSLPEPPQKRRGCFFYGCLTTLALVLAFAVTGFFVVRKIVNKVNQAMLEYTQTTPATLPKVDTPGSELKQLQKRLDDFGTALEAQSNTAPLVLTDREVNALLQQTPQAKDLNLEDHLYLTFASNEILAQVSLPMSNYNAGISFLHTAGRYFNGVATLDASFTNSELKIKVRSVETADNKSLPPEFVHVLQDWDDNYILMDVNNNPTNFGVLTNIESMYISNQLLFIVPKKP